MIWRWIKAFFIVPVVMLAVIPWVLLTAFPFELASPSGAVFWVALILVFPGLALTVAAVRQFYLFGEGTPLPWDPPQKFVVRGPYRFVRNPMITGTMILVAVEALVFQAPSLWALFAFFALVKGFYIPFVEEKELAKRFGQAYLTYKQNVPRWLPRLTPWPGEKE